MLKAQAYNPLVLFVSRFLNWVKLSSPRIIHSELSGVAAAEMSTKPARTSETAKPSEAKFALKIAFAILNGDGNPYIIPANKVVYPCDYHGIVGRCGGQKSLSLSLILIDESSALTIDEFRIHATLRPEVDGYESTTHAVKASNVPQPDRSELPMAPGIYFEMKRFGETEIERVDVDHANNYPAVLYMRDKPAGHWDLFTMVIVDYSTGDETIIDKIDMR